jgi:molybdopterin converting factor small subunit
LTNWQAGVSLNLKGRVLMSITIRLNQVFQEAAAVPEKVAVQGPTVRAGLQDLVAQYPPLKGMIFDSEGKMACLVVYHNEILLPAQIDQPLQDGDDLLLLPLIYGG